jgi:hypothetical protein
LTLNDREKQMSEMPKRQPKRTSVDARITISSGDTRTVDVRINGRVHSVTVPVKLFTHYTEQFVRKNPGEGFQKRFSTLKSLMEAAYKQGWADSLSSRDPS